MFAITAEIRLANARLRLLDTHKSINRTYIRFHFPPRHLNSDGESDYGGGKKLISSVNFYSRASTRNLCEKLESNQ